MKKINKKESIYKLYAPPEEEIGMEFICTMLMNYERNYKDLKKENDKLTKLLLGKSLGFNNYINKDRIREKIKYLEDLMILFTNDKEKFNRYKYTRDTLEKLLEE